MRTPQRPFNPIILFIAWLVGFTMTIAVAQEKRSADPRDLGQTRIVGGNPVIEGAYRWMVSLQSQTDSFHFCGGSLIADRWVLTAAHCVPNASPMGLKVWVGGYDLTRPDTGVEAQIEQIFVHPHYDDQTFKNDIALLKLDQPIGHTLPHVALATLDVMQQAAAPGDIVNVAGWGRLAEAGASPSVLHEVQLPIIDQPTCNAPTSYNGEIDETQLCAGLPQGGQDACQGDSGGPLWVTYQEQHYLAGIVSFGAGCARPNMYGVYTRVERFDTWVASTLNGTATETCQTVSEQEPNDFSTGADYQNLGYLGADQCLTVTGDIHTGFGDPFWPDPNMDRDVYTVSVSGQGRYTFDLHSHATILFGIYDARTGHRLAICQGVCTVQTYTDVLAVEVLAQAASPYELTISDGAARRMDAMTALSAKQAIPAAVLLDPALYVRD